MNEEATAWGILSFPLNTENAKSIYLVSLLSECVLHLANWILHGKTQLDSILPLEYKLHPLEARSAQLNMATKNSRWRMEALSSFRL